VSPTYLTTTVKKKFFLDFYMASDIIFAILISCHILKAAFAPEQWVAGLNDDVNCEKRNLRN
jgi:hypothetical protein